ncbi:hypothetical protein VNO80_00009 [Phaseolus coccineus]|uniref:Uncharacterized protein n=1 Tax=Phaseolus coccineus TaxID=3886 RepID=A0AAN9NYN0_PHACN
MCQRPLVVLASQNFTFCFLPHSYSTGNLLILQIKSLKLDLPNGYYEWALKVAVEASVVSDSPSQSH